MSKQGDGLDNRERLERVKTPGGFSVLDNGIPLLLRRAVDIAQFIRYHNFEGVPDGYFDELLPELKKILDIYARGGEPTFDGTMESSQALILAFLHNLDRITGTFNERWGALPAWYMNELLQVENLPKSPGRVWAAFTKEGRGIVDINKGTAFVFRDSGGNPAVFRLKDQVTLENVRTDKIFSVQYHRQKDLYPAAALDCVTSIEFAEHMAGGNPGELMFPGRKDLSRSRSTGFALVSPALTLREGERHVEIKLKADNDPIRAFMERIRSMPSDDFRDKTDEEILGKLFTDLFYLRISTAEGWSPITGVLVRHDDPGGGDIIIGFILPESFPPTCACREELHSFESEYPALKVYLNLDAWLYPYSWIKDLRLRRISVRTRASGVTDIAVYNELGRIDTSKPFAPFGINTEKGAWFVVGNYEMALKRNAVFDIRIKWGQLPDDPTGLYGYYRSYGSEIDNASFVLVPEYLSSFEWKTEPGQAQLPLFSTEEQTADGGPLKRAPLAAETILKEINTGGMPPVRLPEERYAYNSGTRNGFVRLTLDGPRIGFGEKAYRMLFTRMIADKAFRKATAGLNTPLSPVVERMTLDYRSEDSIDICNCKEAGGNELWHIHPLGKERVFPNNHNKPVPLVYSMEDDTNVIFGLQGIMGGEYVRLYFDFISLKKEADSCSGYNMRWSWGDGYKWKAMSDGMIMKDDTSNFTVSGCVEIAFPPRIDAGMYDKDAILWVCASLSDGYQFVPGLRNIYVNVAELVSDNTDSTVRKSIMSKASDKKLLPVNAVPGLREVTPVSAVTGGRESETDIGKLARVSEYVTHRGRVVVPRDYERIVLQKFPEVAKAKCIPGDTKSGRQGVVTLAVIPAGQPGGSDYMPKAPSDLIIRIEEYLAGCSSAFVSQADVINPVYEEITVRCAVKFRPGYSYGSCRSKLRAVCDALIAPWWQDGGLPQFGYSLRPGDFRDAIAAQEYVGQVGSVSLIQICGSVSGATESGGGYEILEHSGDSDTVMPSLPHAIFVPAAEHIFLVEGRGTFGLDEMSLGGTLIVDKKIEEEQIKDRYYAETEQTDVEGEFQGGKETH